MLEQTKEQTKQLAEQMKTLTDSERCEVLDLLPFCNICGSIEEDGRPCQCWNDE